MYYNSHTYYSLRYGTLSPEHLVKLAKANGIDILGISDINNSGAVLDFVKICNDEGIHPVAGIEFREGNGYLYTGIAQNNDGFRELNEFLSEHSLKKTALPERPPLLPNCYIVYPFNGLYPAKLLDNEYIGVLPSESGRLLSSPLRMRQSKLLLRAPVTFASDSGFELHRNLRAIDNNILLSKLDPSLMASADEIELIGFPQTLTYFDLLQKPVNAVVRAADMRKYIGRRVQMAGLLVTIKYVRTVKKQIMHFAAFLDDSGEFFDSTHFPDTLTKYPFRGNGVYMIYGKIVEEFGFPSLEAERMLKLPLKPDPRSGWKQISDIRNLKSELI